MNTKRFSGRLFLTIAIGTTYCVSSLFLLFVSGLTPESRMGIFLALSTLTTSIVKDYFTRTDRPATEEKKENKDKIV